MTGRTDHPGARPWDEVREAIYWRAMGRCEVCGHPLHGRAEAHHRLKRRYGPDCTCNAIIAHADCHHERIHGHPLLAVDSGWTLPGTVLDVEPASHPVLTALAGWAYLTCDGRYRFELTEDGPAGTVDPTHPSREGADREDPP